jgi:hypothetical protein
VVSVVSRSMRAEIDVNDVFARLSEEDEPSEGASVRKWVGTAVIAGCDASVGLAAKGSHPAQAHSNNRLAHATMALNTDRNDFAACNRWPMLPVRLVLTTGNTQVTLGFQADFINEQRTVVHVI